MIEALRFAARAVARSSTSPGLASFRIRQGRVTASNGVLALSSPIDLSLDAAPAARTFVRALDACGDGVLTIVQESAARLIVRAGTVKAVVPCIPLANAPDVFPDGHTVRVADLVANLQKIASFVSTDSIRPWAGGVLWKAQSIFATNNVVVAQAWLSTPFPFAVLLPTLLVEELIRHKAEPATVQVGEGSITFHYPGGAWMRCLQGSSEWPDVEGAITKNWTDRTPLNERLVSACGGLAKFGGEHVYFKGTEVTTHAEEGENAYLSIAVPAPAKGVYHTRHLLSVLDVATAANFDRYPLPVPWSGDGVRGVLVGLRKE